jgi:hypothetical protein
MRMECEDLAESRIQAQKESLPRVLMQHTDVIITDTLDECIVIVDLFTISSISDKFRSCSWRTGGERSSVQG